MARKKKLPDEIQEIIDNVQNKEKSITNDDPVLYLFLKIYGNKQISTYIEYPFAINGIIDMHKMTYMNEYLLKSLYMEL